LAAAASAAALALASALAFSSARSRIDFGGFRGMNLVVVLVRLREMIAIEEQSAEAIRRAQFKLGVHLDRFERTDFDADLAAHADRDIDVEARRINLHLAYKSGFLSVILTI
jgi:hypothetical protein